MQLTDFIPPILTKALRRTISPPRSRVFDSYGEALAACGQGYNDDCIARIVFEKTRGFIQRGEADKLASGASSVSIVLGLVTAQLVAVQNVLNVMDVGGGVGAHNFYARSMLPGKFRWCVVETQPMVSAGQALANDDLHFVADIEDGRRLLGNRVDLLHSSSTLQYMAEPLAMLARLLSLGAHVVLLSRLPLAEDRSFVISQFSRLSENGPGPLPGGFRDKAIAYPATFLGKRDFEDLITQNYRVIARFKDSGGSLMTPRGMIEGWGYLCILRHDPSATDSSPGLNDS